MSEISFEDRTVIVTGAGNGLGKAYAIDLGNRGAKVVVNDLGGAVDGSGSGSTPADEVVNEIISNGGEAVANYDSVATKEGGESIVQSAIDNFGTVDAVINNAGILRDKSFAKLSEEELSLVIDVHLKGAFFVSQPAFKVMKEKNYGRIVNVASPSGLFGNFGQSNYGAAKMGIVGLTNVLAIEGAKNNIYTNTIAPVAATRMTENLMPEEVLDKLGPELVTPAALFLVSESAPNGVILQAQGGKFSLAGIFENEGVNIGVDATVDDIAENYEAIVDMADLKPRGMLQLNAM